MPDDPRWLERFDEYFNALHDSGMDPEEAAEKAGARADTELIEAKIAEADWRNEERRIA